MEFLEEGGVTPLRGGKKRVKMKEWRGINEKKRSGITLGGDVGVKGSHNS